MSPLRHLCLIAALLVPSLAGAERSALHVEAAVEAVLLTAEDVVAPDARFLSAGLSLDLAPGWKTYWRSPGEVGLPPEIDWSGSTNLASAELLYPAPQRFRAFGIENFGYDDTVTFPLRLTLTDPGAPVALRATVSLLVCADICVPATFDLALDLAAGTGGAIDAESAAEIALWSQRLPLDPEAAGVDVIAAFADETALTVELARPDGWTAPDTFAEFGTYTAFGAPDIRLSPDRTRLWAQIPFLSRDDDAAPLALTVTDGIFAVAFDDIPLADLAPAPPFDIAEPSRDFAALLPMLALAFFGGLILNAMPCVLPVLSIKLASAMQHSNRAPAEVRAGFLATALGTLAFMWVLAAIVLVLQAFGQSVGWGIQFQNPYFIVALLFVLGLFAANLFGLYEIALPAGAATRLARAGGGGYLGDFATGAFAAILATPCSAPLLGTALAFALSGSGTDVVAIFTAMGAGLALPYLIVAARPGLVHALPRPGRWMMTLKAVLGLLLLGTALWLLWVLSSLTSQVLAGGVAVLVVLAALALWQGRRLRPALVAAALVLTAGSALSLPALMTPEARVASTASGAIAWVPFDRAGIARRVAAGEVVFVDVTADWCLTCKANKTLVIDREPVASALAAPGIVPMQADWTRPDATIQSFLEGNGRYGIPFNMVYGPGAPDGIALPEVLTTAAVIAALEAAKAP